MVVVVPVQKLPVVVVFILVVVFVIDCSLPAISTPVQLLFHSFHTVPKPSACAFCEARTDKVSNVPGIVTVSYTHLTLPTNREV